MLAGVWGPASMARPYSQDLRERVVGSVMAGRSCRATAALFGVSVARVVRWCQRYRASGSAAAKRMGGHRRRLLLGERDWLLARIAAKPDLTLRAILAELAARGIGVSYGALWSFVAAEGRAAADPQRRRQAVLPAELLARPQPDRAGLRQAQDPVAQARPAYR